MSFLTTLKWVKPRKIIYIFLGSLVSSKNWNKSKLRPPNQVQLIVNNDTVYRFRSYNCSPEFHCSSNQSDLVFIIGNISFGSFGHVLCKFEEVMKLNKKSWKTRLNLLYFKCTLKRFLCKIWFIIEWNNKETDKFETSTPWLKIHERQ